MLNSEELVKDVKALVSSCMADGKLDSGEILRIGIFAAEKVNSVKDMNGSEKKKLVLEVVTAGLKAALSDEQYQKVGSTFALQVLPVVLDIAVNAARGKIGLGKAVAAASGGILSRLLACFVGKSVAVEEPAVAVAVAPVAPVASVEPDSVKKIDEAVAAVEVRKPSVLEALRHVEAETQARNEERRQQAAPLSESASQVSQTPPPSSDDMDVIPNVVSEKEPSPAA
jgi:hypothetical protein